MSLPICAPSWVIPGSMAENAAFLQEKVSAIMACLFECAPALPNPLPGSAHGLSWHIHLPLDLPWQAGGHTAARAARQSMSPLARYMDEKSLLVLHPPPSSAPGLLSDFVKEWEQLGEKRNALLLENQPEQAFDELRTMCETTGLHLCLDVAHLALLDEMKHAVTYSGLREQVRMMHWSAPKQGRDAHAPLTELEPGLRSLYRSLAQALQPCVDVIEVFDWEGVCASWEELRLWRE